MKGKFSDRLSALIRDAVASIDNYDGPKAVTLTTGEKAIDMDDAWLITGKGTPVIRHKKDQAAIEGGREPSWGDKPLSGWSPEDIASLADKLAATKN